ncbi:MAG: type II toxin-antitoxin system RelE/ParE family toxin, partial [bacterium]
ISSAQKDFEKLDKRKQILVAKQLVKLENNPFAGQHLGNKAGINLTGYYKLYVDKKKIRIVYSVIEEEVCVKIITIGEREELAVYREALKRIKGNQ